MQDVSDDFELHNGIKVSLAASKGNVRPQMEDALDVANFSIGNRVYYGFGIYDGHCGTLKDPAISTVGFVQQHFMKYLERQLTRTNNIRDAIQETFLLLDHDLRSEDSGSTVSLVLIVDEPNQKREIWVANVGDSSIYGFCRHPEKIQRLSVDHKPQLKSEMKQMKLKSETSGMKFEIDDGYVVNRDGDSLAMTRSLGDCSFQDFITSKPTITQVKQHFDIVLLASDGLHDCMSGKKLWEFIKDKKPHKVAKKLLDYRNKTFNQHDNSALIALFL